QFVPQSISRRFGDAGQSPIQLGRVQAKQFTEKSWRAGGGVGGCCRRSRFVRGLRQKDPASDAPADQPDDGKGRAHGNTGLLHRYFFQYSQQRLVGLWRQPVDRVKIVPQLIGVQRNRLRRRVKVGGESVQRQRHPLAPGRLILPITERRDNDGQTRRRNSLSGTAQSKPTENLRDVPLPARVALDGLKDLRGEVRRQGRVWQPVEQLAQRHFFLPDRPGLRIASEASLHAGFFFTGQLAPSGGVQQLVEGRVVHGVDTITRDRQKLRLLIPSRSPFASRASIFASKSPDRDESTIWWRKASSQAPG